MALGYLGWPKFEHSIPCQVLVAQSGDWENSRPGSPGLWGSKTGLPGPGTKPFPQLSLGPAVSPGVMSVPVARPIWSREATRLCPEWLSEGPLRQAQSFGRVNPARKGRALWHTNAPSSHS